MAAVNPLVGFLARFLIVFVLLMAPWPGLHEAYAACLRITGGQLFKTFGSDGRVHFFPSATLPAGEVPPGYEIPRASRGSDIHVRLSSLRAPGRISLLHLNSRIFGYLRTAFVIALILATPIPWRRRWWALVWGSLIVSGLILLQFALALFYAFGLDGPVAQFSLSPFSRSVVSHLYQFFVVGVAGTYILPLPIWVLVTFRREDSALILAEKRAS